MSRSGAGEGAITGMSAWRDDEVEMGDLPGSHSSSSSSMPTIQGVKCRSQSMKRHPPDPRIDTGMLVTWDSVLLSPGSALEERHAECGGHGIILVYCCEEIMDEVATG